MTTTPAGMRLTVEGTGQAVALIHGFADGSSTFDSLLPAVSGNARLGGTSPAMCAVPGSDLFKAIKSGQATVVTDHIATFTEADIYVTPACANAPR